MLKCNVESTEELFLPYLFLITQEMQFMLIFVDK